MGSDYDVIVAGAGLAGVCAAAAAARAGANTLVIEKEAFAGGVSTAGIETSICNYFHNAKRDQVVAGIPAELIGRMVERGGVSGNWYKHRGHVVFDVEIGKLCMDEIMEEAGADILYGTLITDALTRGNTVRGVAAANRSGLREYTAGCVVDATGDADVAVRAGIPLHTAPNEHSILFRIGNVDTDAMMDYFRANPDQYITGFDISMTFDEFISFYEDTGIAFFNHGCGRKMKIIQDAVARGDIPEPYGPFKRMYAFQMHAMRSNSTMIINTGFFKMKEPDGREISDILRRGRKLAHLVAEFMRRDFPGCGNSFVIATSSAPGLRRTRYLKTDYTMTREIYDQGPVYGDRIGRGVVVEKSELRVTDRTFDIPLRSVVPPEYEGLIMGSGRSASCVPAELFRTMPVTMNLGQGAGTAAAVAAGTGTSLHALDMSAVHRELEKEGALIRDT